MRSQTAMLANFPIVCSTIFWIMATPPLAGQAEVSPVFSTPTRPGANVDSCAVWVAPDPAESLLFVTEKEGDHVQVWRAASGAEYSPRPFLGGSIDSSEPGEFNRPNGVWVIYHVPYDQGFTDILLVTEQLNSRVQIFRLPQLELLGEFGAGQVGRGYGISWYQDTRDFFVFITDNVPPEAFPGKIKKYRLQPEGDGLTAELVLSVGSEDGTPRLSFVESVLADLPLNRLHLCGDELGNFVRLFELDGDYTGVVYGDAFFESDSEGINLYHTRQDGGYLIVSDQLRGGVPNEYEIFDRQSLDHLGNFHSPPEGATVTRNTDGCFLEQRPLPGFPNGLFFAVNDDQNVHAYDWTDIAAALELEIVPLDRPFSTVQGDGLSTSGHRARRAVWFHDGSWWAVFPNDQGLAIHRLEDGTFQPRQTLAASALGTVWSQNDGLVVVATDPEEIGAQVLSLEYERGQRRYVFSGDPIAVEGVRSPYPSFVRAPEEDGLGGHGTMAWVEREELYVAASDSELSNWQTEALGPAAEVLPAMVLMNQSVGLVWAAPGRLLFRRHEDEEPLSIWGGEETIAEVEVNSLSATSHAAIGVVVVASTATGGWVSRRSDLGMWTGQSLEGALEDVAVVADPDNGNVHLYNLETRDGNRVLRHRVVALATLAVTDEERTLGWPQAHFQSLLYSPSVPEGAPDAVVLALADDGRGYFMRTPLGIVADISAPITMQHTPSPETEEVAKGETLFFRIVDDSSGVDKESLRLLINGEEVAPTVRGVPRNYLVTHVLPVGAGPLTVRIEAQDRAVPANRMVPFEYELEVTQRQPNFRRGDTNEDGVVDVADVLAILFFLFAGGPASVCADAQDVTDDGLVQSNDAVLLLEYLFLGGQPPPAPTPLCGRDPTPDELHCEVSSSGCE